MKHAPPGLPLRLLFPVLVASLTAGGAWAQNLPASGINRNPAFRDQLPPAPVPAPDARDTVVPGPAPDDPRDSDSRPTLPPTSRDGRDAPVPGTASTGPTHPTPPQAVPDAMPR